MPEQENGQVVETAIEARGAERGPTVRNVAEPALPKVMCVTRLRVIE